MLTLLLTNDDGYFSEGVNSLKRVLSEEFEVYIIAPDKERSAISMALTLNHPLRVTRIEEKIFSIDGTPSDCINIALQKIMVKRPDFIISGMNFGENLSEDIFFSGTVGGAFSGFLYGIPAMAVSLLPELKNKAIDKYNIENGVEITRRILKRLLSLPKQDGVYNVNIPYDNNGKIKVTSLGNKRYRPEIIERNDPKGRKYYWIGTGNPVHEGTVGTDVWAIKNRCISLSLINYNMKFSENLKTLAEAFDKI